MQEAKVNGFHKTALVGAGETNAKYEAICQADAELLQTQACYIAQNTECQNRSKLGSVFATTRPEITQIGNQKPKRKEEVENRLTDLRAGWHRPRVTAKVGSALENSDIRGFAISSELAGDC